jgi:hypothetical protein
MHLLKIFEGRLTFSAHCRTKLLKVVLCPAGLDAIHPYTAALTTTFSKLSCNELVPKTYSATDVLMELMIQLCVWTFVWLASIMKSVRMSQLPRPVIWLL